jgi:hypothetical protein
VKICQFLVHNGRLVRSSIFLKQDSFQKPKTYLSAPLRNCGSVCKYLFSFTFLQWVEFFIITLLFTFVFRENHEWRYGFCLLQYCLLFCFLGLWNLAWCRLACEYRAVLCASYLNIILYSVTAGSHDVYCVNREFILCCYVAGVLLFIHVNIFCHLGENCCRLKWCICGEVCDLWLQKWFIFMLLSQIKFVLHVLISKKRII